VRDVERQFQNFQYGQAGQQIYDFIWNDFADWYVEVAKEQLKHDATKARTADTLARVFDMSLRLLHPFTPFVTEEIWGHLHSAMRESSVSDICKDWPAALIIAKFPEPRPLEGWEETKTADFEVIQEIVRAIRNLRAEKKVKSSQKLTSIFVSDRENTSLLQSQKNILVSLAGLDANHILINEKQENIQEGTIPLGSSPIEGYVTSIVGPVEIFLSLVELAMVDTNQDRARLEKELREADSHIQRLENLLGGDFANKAPAALVQKERDKLAGYKDTAEKIKAQLK